VIQYDFVFYFLYVCLLFLLLLLGVVVVEVVVVEVVVGVCLKGWVVEDALKVIKKKKKGQGSMSVFF
jgi:hypothetical protein